MQLKSAVDACLKMSPQGADSSVTTDEDYISSTPASASNSTPASATTLRAPLSQVSTPGASAALLGGKFLIDCTQTIRYCFPKDRVCEQTHALPMPPIAVNQLQFGLEGALSPAQL